MFDPGTRITLTKGYRGVQGIITAKTESRFEFYVVKLDNGIHIIVGPSSFIAEKESSISEA
jgi:hypothetical protein